jgi:AcrR family transcriptional regulator
MLQCNAMAPPRRPRTNKRDKILNAAERLFAKKGFHGVSVREIARAAGVDVALVSYHVGKKAEVFDAVLLRRAEVLNAERLQMLEDCIARAAPEPPRVEDIIDAFTHPLLNRSTKEGRGWKDYFSLVAHINNNPAMGGVLISRYFDPIVRRFLDALRMALPDCDERDLYWSYHFLSGALTLTFAETKRIDALSGGLCQSSDLDAVHQRLVPFAAAGFKRLCEPPAKAKPAKRRSSSA